MRDLRDGYNQGPNPQTPLLFAAGYDEMTHINQVMRGWVLELYQNTGFSHAEILRRATYDMAVYLDQDQGDTNGCE
ncbi:MAG: hypothetical protein ACI9ON_002672 [Limisphaerales bacterium]